MKNRPVPVYIVATLFITAGLVGFIYHMKDFFEPGEKLYEIVAVEFLRVLAIFCGILLLRANNIGRWLSIAWVLLHVVKSFLHTTAEMVVHIILLIAITFLLFLPSSSAYFRNKKLT